MQKGPEELVSLVVEGQSFESHPSVQFLKPSTLGPLHALNCTYLPVVYRLQALTQHQLLAAGRELFED